MYQKEYTYDAWTPERQKIKRDDEYFLPCAK